MARSRHPIPCGKGGGGVGWGPVPHLHPHLPYWVLLHVGGVNGPVGHPSTVHPAHAQQLGWWAFRSMSGETYTRSVTTLPACLPPPHVIPPTFILPAFCPVRLCGPPSSSHEFAATPATSKNWHPRTACRVMPPATQPEATYVRVPANRSVVLPRQTRSRRYAAVALATARNRQEMVGEG